MSDTDDGGIGRRKVLAAAAGAGGLGLAGGVGSAALLRDSESFGALFGSGSLQLDVAWESVESGAVGIKDGELTAMLEPKDRDGSALLELSLPGSNNNPAHVWFQPSCPPDDAAGLADALTLDIHDPNADGDQSRLARGTLRTLAEQSGTKLRFGGADCLPADGPRYLLVKWEYTGTAADFDTAAFDLKLFATQCRNETDPANPYPGGECATPTPTPSPTPAPCPCCRLVGKRELTDSYVAPGRYGFSEGLDDYELEIDATETKDGGAETVAVSVDVVGVDGTPDPELCEVVLKAGGGPPNSGTDLVSYTGADLDGEGDATPLLHSVPRIDSPSAPGDYFGISSITVGTCVERDGDDDCPEDVVSPTGNAGGDS